MNLLKDEWLPKCKMVRVICHWTAGAYSANDTDKKAYHILIEGDGKVVRGTHSIKDNVSTGDGVYAAHTLMSNTGSIGVSCCAMAASVKAPFKAGTHPLKEIQWETLARVVAELCRAYDIPVKPTTVLGHGEVETTLGIKQHDKWDPLVLPWALSLSRTQVGDQLRANVKKNLETPPAAEPPVPIMVVSPTLVFTDPVMANGQPWVKLEEALAEVGGTVIELIHSQGEITARVGPLPGAHPVEQTWPVIELGAPYVELDHVVEIRELTPSWDAAKTTITLG